jgi:hypothetical protein
MDVRRSEDAGVVDARDAVLEPEAGEVAPEQEEEAQERLTDMI